VDVAPARPSPLPVSVAGGLCRTPRELASELDRECDAVRLRGVVTDLLDDGVLVGGPNLVAAFAANCLASEHVTTDTARVRLEVG